MASYDFAALQGKQKIKASKKNCTKYYSKLISGFMYGVDVLKSVILMLAVVEREITVNEAITLARLEEEFQV